MTWIENKVNSSQEDVIELDLTPAHGQTTFGPLSIELGDCSNRSNHEVERYNEAQLVCAKRLVGVDHV